MKEWFQKIFSNRILKWLFLAIILLGGYYFFTNEDKKVDYSIFSVTAKTLKQNIVIAGVVKPAESVDMSFEASGRIAKISTKIGDQVVQGQELIVLDNKEARARVAQASAQVSSANAVYRQAESQLIVDQLKLDELKRGPRAEAIDLSRSKLSATKEALLDAQRNQQIVKDRAERDVLSLIDNAQTRLQEAYVDADAAVNQYSDPIFNNDQTSNPELSFSTSNQQDKILAENLRVQMKVELDNLKRLSLLTLTDKDAQIDVYLTDANKSLLKVVTFLDAVKSALGGSFSLSSTDLNNYKTAVNTARSSVLSRSNSVMQVMNNLKTQRLSNQNNLAVAEASVTSAINNVSIAEKELSVVVAGASSEEIRGQEAIVRQKKINIEGALASLNSARANLLEAEANLDKTILKAPFDGKITKVNATVGQLVLSGNNTESLISIVSKAGLQVEVNIPEIDIAKVAPNNQATISVDAYGETVVFDGVVSTIETAETVINGVPTYKTIVQFITQDERLKPGMTANLDITTATVEAKTVVPVKAVTYKNGEYYLEVVSGEKNEKIDQVKVTVGLKSSDGFYEIIGGVNPGDKVIIQP